MIKIKRVYDEVEKSDGYRVLVDRLWPRGIKREELVFDEWAQELSPSSKLRKEFSHEKKNWKNFIFRFKKELSSPTAQDKLKELAKKARKRNVTLIFAAKDEEHNNAVVLKDMIEKEIRDINE